jgi:hypothetical protein
MYLYLKILGKTDKAILKVNGLSDIYKTRYISTVFQLKINQNCNERQFGNIENDSQEAKVARLDFA